MQLYILRHGIAFEHSEWAGTDFTRPLTVEGMEKTREVIKALVEKKNLAVDLIWSSPLVRALQTATIAAEVLAQPVVTVDALSSGTSLKRLLEAKIAKEELPKSLMLVGHEPDCGLITGELAGDPGGPYEFKKAGMASLSGSLKPGGMKLQWLLAPKDVL
jgi:phosphohistidine phosphatase